MWRFFIIHPKDKSTGGFYVDKNGERGNMVFRFIEKDFWTCTCQHFVYSADENCKHICAAKLRMDSLVEGVVKRIKDNPIIDEMLDKTIKLYV